MVRVTVMVRGRSMVRRFFSVRSGVGAWLEEVFVFDSKSENRGMVRVRVMVRVR